MRGNLNKGSLVRNGPQLTDVVFSDMLVLAFSNFGKG